MSDQQENLTLVFLRRLDTTMDGLPAVEPAITRALRCGSIGSSPGSSAMPTYFPPNG